MTSKVFMFENKHWLYCTNVTLSDGIWKGWVVNGAWHMTANTKTNTIKSDRHSHETKIVWMCNPNTICRDYNQVIENAQERYSSGEPANYAIKEVLPEDDEVAF